MSFMEAQLTVKQAWYELETNNGLWFVPADIPNCTQEAALACLDNDDEITCDELIQYTEGTGLHGVRLIYGYGVRSSAPGYMDCTEWSVYTNLRSAERAYRQEERECEGEDL